jgi:hypothetical protein
MLTQTAPAELPVGHLGFGAMRVRLAPHRQAGRRSGRGRPRADDLGFAIQNCDRARQRAPRRPIRRSCRARPEAQAPP